MADSRREIEEAHRREIDLENRHETLQCAALGAVAAVNARGVSLEDRLISRFMPEKWQLMRSAIVPMSLWL